ncbi:hypothetical protein SAMN06264855_105129 [Halorubrum vacuolatum]|uniref:PGF-CTERM protein n=1 Tax=Halorubrum vacuolatum TaxID=63740 RepID=A0A238W7E6_HALVU|nr:hypothetical protein SAMN06264855_105129 [Halorubrum vacuolatum]
MADFEGDKAFFTEPIPSASQGDIFVQDVYVPDSTSDARLHLSHDEYEASVALDLPTAEPVTLGVNTYAAGHPDHGDDFVTVLDGEGSATLLDQPTTDDLLAPGEYDLTVQATADGDPDDGMTLTLDPRETRSLTAFTSDTLTPADLSDPEAVAAARETGALEPADTVSEDDTLVFVANATGLDGLLDAGGPIDGVDDLASHEGLAVELVAEPDTTDDPPRATLTDDALASASTAGVADDRFHAAMRFADIPFENGTPDADAELRLSVAVTDDRVRTTNEPFEADVTDDPDLVSTTLIHAGDPSDGEDSDVDDGSVDDGSADDESTDDGSTTGGSGGGSGGGSTGSSGGTSGSDDSTPEGADGDETGDEEATDGDTEGDDAEDGDDDVAIDDDDLESFIENVTDAGDPENVTAFANATDAENVTALANATDAENITEIANSTHIENVTDVENVTDLANITAALGVTDTDAEDDASGGGGAAGGGAAGGAAGGGATGGAAGGGGGSSGTDRLGGGAAGDPDGPPPIEGTVHARSLPPHVASVAGIDLDAYRDDVAGSPRRPPVPGWDGIHADSADEGGSDDDGVISLSDLNRVDRDGDGSGWITADEVPGFGPGQAVLALALTLFFGRSVLRRQQ